MVSTKYIQATVHSSSPEKKEKKKNILQSQTVTTVKAVVRETVMAIVNRTIQNRCQCHTSRSGPNVKIDKPPSQVTHCTWEGKQPEGLGGGVEGKIIARPQRRCHQGGPPHLIQGDKGGGQGMFPQDASQ